MVTFLGDTPLFVIVIVAPPVLPPGFGVGEVALSPPQAVRLNPTTTAHARSMHRIVDMILDLTQFEGQSLELSIAWPTTRPMWHDLPAPIGVDVERLNRILV